MKKYQIPSLLLVLISNLHAEGLESYQPEQKPTSDQVESLLVARDKQAQKLSKNEDELSADVQEMIEDQTNEKVIQLFEEVEDLMANVTDNLAEAETGKDTIFNENKIIEKIFEAAKLEVNNLHHNQAKSQVNKRVKAQVALLIKKMNNLAATKDQAELEHLRKKVELLHLNFLANIKK